MIFILAGDKAQNPNRVPVNSNAKKFVKKPKVDFQVWSLTHFFSLYFVEKIDLPAGKQTNDHLRKFFSFVPPSKLIYVGLGPPAGLFELTHRPSRALALYIASRTSGIIIRISQNTFNDNCCQP